MRGAFRRHDRPMRKSPSMRFTIPLLSFLMVSLPGAFARAETYTVGPGLQYETIQDTLDLLGPGDIVEVMGDHTYPGDLWFREDQAGAPGMPVTIRGIRVNGRRPVIEGVGTEQWHDMIVLFNASHFVFEGFEINGDGNHDHQGLVHKADDVVLRDLVGSVTCTTLPAATPSSHARSATRSTRTGSRARCTTSSS